MNDFEFANAFVAKWEGGYVDHPKDPGGATNYGVSLTWIRGAGIDINEDGIVDVKDIKALTPEIAAKLFKEEFWDKLKCDSLPRLTAIATYDAAINVGRGQAVKFLQRAYNKVGNGELVVDGAIGPKTVQAVNDAVGRNVSDYDFCKINVDLREAFYKQLANNSPYPDGRDYRGFLKGWLRRTVDLLKYIK